MDYMGQKLTKKLSKIIFVFSNNAITSKVFRIFLWNKKKWKVDKIVFLIIYTFVYFKENVFPKYALIFQILQKFGNFRHFGGVFLNYFCLWLEWAPSWVFQRIRTEIYTSTYFPEKVFSKFARRFQILQKLGHFFIIILHSFL